MDGGSDDGTNDGDIEPLADDALDSDCDREAHVNATLPDECSELQPNALDTVPESGTAGPCSEGGKSVIVSEKRKTDTRQENGDVAG